MNQFNGKVGLVAVDCRAHGLTEGEEEDLSIENLIDDFIAVIQSFQRQWTVPHQIFLVGHSLGGSVVTWIAERGTLRDDLLGVIVIDIVEEAALRALNKMPQILSDRPYNFNSIEESVEWAIESKTCHNKEAARISIPSQLRQANGGFVWRVDLLRSRQHWSSWFKGLSKAFVESNVAKILILAEREYLDRTLMIASMQGKFQCSIIRDTGHAIQEDKPEQLAELISSFVNRILQVTQLNNARQTTLHR